MPQPLEELGRRVDSGDPCGRETLREGTRDDPRSTADVGDVSDGSGVESLALQLGKDVVDERQDERSVDVERVGHRVPVEVPAPVVMMAVPARCSAMCVHGHSMSPSRALAAASATRVRLDFGVSSA